MAREVAALDARTATLRDRLRAYAVRTRGDYVAPETAKPDPTRNPWSPPPAVIEIQAAPRIASTPAIGAACAERVFIQERLRDTTREATAWTAYAAALAADPQAESGFAEDAPVPSTLPLPAPRAA